MDPTRFETPPRWWGPRLSPLWLHLWRPLRQQWLKRQQQLHTVDVTGEKHLRRVIDEGCGILITPNHSAHADALALYAAADQIGCLLYFMAAWQVLGLANPLRRLILRHHGCFSVHREGSDLKAFKCAVDLLQNGDYPLVIFPEGEVYHLNEKVTPFREGPAAIALAAARKATRKIVCIPCGLRYHYTRSPVAGLEQVMADLERSFTWRPTPEEPLDRRIYRFAEGIMSLKELEYTGQTEQGPLPDRVNRLTDTILSRIESRYDMTAKGTTPERVKALRQRAIKLVEESTEHSPERQQANADLADVYLVIQMFSYPGDYVAGRPCVERMAETLDKFEEDILGRQTATIRGQRRATVTFGEPIEVTADRKQKHAIEDLTQQVEDHVQGLLDQTPNPDDRSFEIPSGATLEQSARSS